MHNINPYPQSPNYPITVQITQRAPPSLFSSTNLPTVQKQENNRNKANNHLFTNDIIDANSLFIKNTINDNSIM
jgi:hypothetical protein